MSYEKTFYYYNTKISGAKSLSCKYKIMEEKNTNQTQSDAYDTNLSTSIHIQNNQLFKL